MSIYVPQRNEIIWLDFDPSKRKEVGKYLPALILSSHEYNKKTGLVICCPISTSIRNAPTEVPVTNLQEPSVVVASLIQTLNWKERNAKKIIEAETGLMEEVLMRLIPLIGADKIIDDLVNQQN